jgi:hypothetical protein
MAYLWHLWPGRGWPCTPAEEKALVAAWESSGDVGIVRRDAMIVIMGALRSGSSADEVRRITPGVSDGDLAASYRHLDRVRADAAAAFARMCHPADFDSFERDAAAAAALTPGPVGLLRRVAYTSGLDGLREAGMHVQRRSAQVRAEADEVVSTFATSPDPVSAGRLLFDPYTPGLWGDPYFVAERVGEITPVRVRMLLGEPADGDLIFAEDDRTTDRS